MDTNPNKRVIPVVGAVIVFDGQVLCARRGPGGKLSGYWEFPGGKVEADESPRQALAREIGEELRCEIEVGQKIEETPYEYDFATIVLTTFYCQLLSGEPLLTDHDEVRWCTPNQMAELTWAPADVPAVERVRHELNHAG